MSESRTNTASQAGPPPGRFVPATIEPAFETPLRPKRIGLLLGLPGVWLLPKRTGPHLAESTWSKAVTANLLGLVAVGLLALLANMDRFQMLPEYPDLGPLANLRARLAEAILYFVQSGRLSVLVYVPGTLAAVELGVVALACGLFAWIPAGEKPRALAVRAIKMALWTSSVTIPITAFFLLGNILAGAWREATREWAIAVGVFGSSGYLLWVSLRSGLGYAGPAEGPGFEPLVPVCAACGYNLCGLEKDGRCPECGLGVQRSIEPAGRQPSIFAAARGPLAKFAAYWRLLPVLILRPEPFYNGLAAKREHAAARIYALLTWLQLSVVVSVLLYGYGWIDDDFESPYSAREHTAFVLRVALPLLALMWGMAFAVAVGCWRRLPGVDTRNVACATFYASGCAWPLAIFVALAICGLHHFETYRVAGVRLIDTPAFSMSVYHLVAALAVVAVVGLLGFWTLRTQQAVGLTRYSSF